GSRVTSSARSAEDLARGLIAHRQPRLGGVIPHHLPLGTARLVERIGIGGIPGQPDAGDVSTGHGRPLPVAGAAGGPSWGVGRPTSGTGAGARPMWRGGPRW